MPADSFRELHVALARSLAALDAGTHDAQDHLGAIDLPDAAPGGSAERAGLEPAGPLYLAWQLELAGLLRTAELIAGLFASGAITASLGAAEPLIAAFWRDRTAHLAPQERMEVFGRVFEAPWFDSLLGALMQAIARAGDTSNDDTWSAPVLLEQSGERLVDFLSSRTVGIIAYAAREITATLVEAVRFLREPALLAAFSVHDLWQLLRFAASDPDLPQSAMQQHVELGKSGAVVLSWLASAAGSAALRLSPATLGFDALVGAARQWLLASGATDGAPTGAGATAPALVPMAPIAPAPLSPRRPSP
jgi:hypothetical protein